MDAFEDLTIEHLKLKVKLGNLEADSAICPMCQVVCSASTHEKKIKKIKGSKKLLDDFLKRIGKNERQVTLRESILGKRTKNVADFDDKTKL